MDTETNLSSDDVNYWNSKQEGMKFGDTEEESSPDGKQLEAIQSIRDSLPDEDLASIKSYDSNTSDTGFRGYDQTVSDLPNFLLQNLSHDYHYESNLELRLASLKSASASIPLQLESPNSCSTKHALQGFLMGQEVSLESFRSFHSKKKLLNKAIEINDGNAITAVVIFLRQTLRESLFQLLLMEHKAAANHYIRYLETRSETAKLVDLLSMLGRTHDALIVRYKTILRSSNLDRIQTQLKHFYVAECSNSDEDIAVLVQSHSNLIETCKQLIQKKNPVPESVNRLSVLSVLRHLARNYYDQDPSFLLSPAKFGPSQHLTKKQYAWVCCLELAKLQKWPQLQSLLISKGWIGTTQVILPVEEICKLLDTNDAPVDLISMFVLLMQNPREKLNTAKRLKCHKIVVDIYASRKEAASIKGYISGLKLEPKSKDAIYAEAILRTLG